MKDMDKTISMILAKVKPGKGVSVGMGSPEMEEEAGGDDLSMIAEELIAAVKEGDTKGVVEALRGAFLHLDAQPHVEGEHTNEMEEEGEEEEGEEDESTAHEVGEKYGAGKELFGEYFGGGSVKKPGQYAKGGRATGDKSPRGGLRGGGSKVC